MTSTIILEVVTADGTACWRGLDQTEYQVTPPSSFAEYQAGRIPVNIAHDSAPIGFVDFLEHRPDSYNGALMAVAVIDAPAIFVDGLMASAEIRANAMHTVERHSYRLDRSVLTYGKLEATYSVLDGIGIVARTAGVTATKIVALDGDYRGADWGLMKAYGVPPIIERAKAQVTWELRHSRPQELRIHRPDDRVNDEYRHGGRPEIVHHGGGRVLAVRSA